MDTVDEPGYNERLFSGGLRTRVHLARFHWVHDQIARYGCPQHSVLELGCFDGKMIEFLPRPPERYVGYDADWEGGLGLATVKWAGHQQYAFHKAWTPKDICLRPDDRFDLAICMETLEHIQPEHVDEYLRKIAAHLDGYFLVTVPNEKGILFLLKWLAKWLLRGDKESYSPGELWNQTMGRCDKVARHEHKGFDYARAIAQLGEHFDIVDVQGHPFGTLLPKPLCFGIGIVARTTRRNALTA